MSNNLKRFARIFLYTIFIGFIIYLGNIIQNKLNILMATTFKYHFINFSFMVLYPVIIGLLIASPNFIILVKKAGLLKFDWIKFFAIGTPIIFILFFPFLNYTAINPYIPIFLNRLVFVITGKSMSYTTVSGVIFGYLILSLFIKNNIITIEDKIIINRSL